MTPPALSVCATNYNCAHALEDHLKSIETALDGLSFEYSMVDNVSRDGSPEILRRWAETHPAFRWTQRRCTRGRGRELAVRATSAPWILIVDTDTLYHPMLRTFVERCMEEHPGTAVQGIYAGMYPRDLWARVGGMANMNVGEDFDLWMRLWKIGRMRWYPARLGENWKEAGATDRQDYLSSRYTPREKLSRLIRSELDLLRLTRYDRYDLESVWRDNQVDFGLGPLESTWFGHAPSPSLLRRLRLFAGRAFRIIRP